MAQHDTAWAARPNPDSRNWVTAFSLTRRAEVESPNPLSLHPAGRQPSRVHVRFPQRASKLSGNVARTCCSRSDPGSTSGANSSATTTKEAARTKPRQPPSATTRSRDTPADRCRSPAQRVRLASRMSYRTGIGRQILQRIDQIDPGISLNKPDDSSDVLGGTISSGMGMSVCAAIWTKTLRSVATAASRGTELARGCCHLRLA